MKQISNVVYKKNEQKLHSFNNAVDLFIDLEKDTILLFSNDFRYSKNKTEIQSGLMISIIFDDEKQSSDFYEVLTSNLDNHRLYGYVEIKEVIDVIFNINRYNKFKTINIAITND